MGLATLRTPFPTLASDNQLGMGCAGQVYAISRNVAFKCPWSFDNAAPSQERQSKESVEKIDREKRIFEMLMDYPHKHIVRGILCIPEGIFMQRLECSLRDRLNNSNDFPIDSGTQCRWIRELASAVEWLESLNLAHGDLRPANILLDAAESVHLCDFESTAKFGEELYVASVPFCKVDRNFVPPLAGPVSEQYAVGTCIYNIRTGHQPWHEIEGPLMARRLVDGYFPTTSDDRIFGDIILRCWQGYYKSVADLEKAIHNQLYEFNQEVGGTAIEGSVERCSAEGDQALLAQCETFIRKASTIVERKQFSEVDLECQL